MQIGFTIQSALNRKSGHQIKDLYCPFIIDTVIMSAKAPV